MNSPAYRLALVVVAAFSAAAIRGQDRVDTEPVDASIDPAQLTYDYLVDGNLAQDDSAHHAYRTVQAAYAAAPAGTAAKPTIIGIKPNVYFLRGHAPRGASLSVTKDYITFLGLTNNRRAVVLADNRGLMQGADDDGYMLDVNATGFTARNLTLINYCNTDYDYPGDPAKNLRKRSDVITQAVALQASGDRHVYDNVALLSRLDTMFLRTTRSYFHNVYIEGTDDWVGGGRISVWEDCTLVYPTGRGVMSASNIVFRHCRFEAAHGMEWYKEEFRGAERPDALIECVVPTGTPGAPVAWIRGRAAPRPSQYSLTYHVTEPDGHPARIRDATIGPRTFGYTRELTDEEVKAYNAWNLLRSAPNAARPDEWDPAGVRQRYESAGALPYRIELGGSGATIRTGGPGTTLTAKVLPGYAADPTIRWSTKSDLVSLAPAPSSDVGGVTSPRNAILVTARNTTENTEWVPIDAVAANGFRVTAYVKVEPKLIAPPSITRGPSLDAPHGGTLAVDYAFADAGRADKSLITWSICDDAAGAHARPVAVTRGDEPLKALVLTPGMVGRYVRATIEPKNAISEPGPAVSVTAAQPISAADVLSSDVSPNFKNFVTEPNDAYVSGCWTVLGKWEVMSRDDLPGGWGIHATAPGALLYQWDRDTGDMQVDVLMTPEKTEGTGFSVPGSPADSGERNLHADIYIKYDPRTQTGYALRYWRTTQSAKACMFQWYKIVNGIGSPVDDRQVLTGVFKRTTHLTLSARGDRLRVTGSNTVDGETLTLESVVAPNRHGGAGVNWPRGSTNIFSRIAITY